ncbi:transporter substrate-binding domain-containing protein [Bradyrhizobium cenepequi]|uniref:transporter substrate-binding domain-containing protein n=1 Tax=Bradyrhizobium cenepequi TaxID=2821403 RepID=UPI001CE2EC40|nr:transporter substrate-binding domain-containing protein [Bradyrhizobium cenepequi]MCA6112202.1 transporter substrate-binding domain-containing protein [Bradyrhizobium cenepequi]
MRVRSKASVLVVLLSLAISYPTFAQHEGRLFASIRKARAVKVALASLPPYITMSPNGEATGSSVDLQKMVLKSMGFHSLKPMLMGWDAMIPALQAYQFDYIGAGLAISEERCKVLVFSAPYYAAQAGLFVLPGNPKHLTSVANVAERPDIKLAMLPSLSSYQGYALKKGVKPDQIIIVPDVQAGAATVLNGRADAYMGGQFNIPHPADKGLNVIVDEQSPVIASAAAFRKEDVAFRDAFNQQLNLLIRNGTMQSLYEQYGIANGDEQARLLAKFAKASDVVPSCE